MAEISFDRSLYAPEAVDAAVAAYSEHAKVEIKQVGAAIVAVISEVAADYDPEVVAHSFSNHVLHETVARRRQAALQEGT